LSNPLPSAADGNSKAAEELLPLVYAELRQLAFAIHADGQIHKADVFRWDHETDSRSWFASGVEQYLEARLKKAAETDDDGF
jgi:hypothetical protein